MNDALANFKLSKIRQGLDEARSAAVVASEDPPAAKDDTGAPPVGDPGKDDD